MFHVFHFLCCALFFASNYPPRYKNSSTQTVGVEFGSRIITMGGKRVKLQIWDTAGQERFRAVTRSYYRGAAGAIIVYDISNRDSFSHVQQWLNDAQQLAGEHICMMVVGNKADLQGEREVTFLEASRVAQEAEVLFLETSALTGEGVEDIFMRVARGIHARTFVIEFLCIYFVLPLLTPPPSTLRRHGQRLARSNESIERNSILGCTCWRRRFDLGSALACYVLLVPYSLLQ